MERYKAQLRLHDAGISQSIIIYAVNMKDASLVAKRAKRDFGQHHVEIRSIKPDKQSYYSKENLEGYIVLGGNNSPDSELVEVNIRQEKLYSFGIN